MTRMLYWFNVSALVSMHSIGWTVISMPFVICDDIDRDRVLCVVVISILFVISDDVDRSGCSALWWWTMQCSSFFLLHLLSAMVVDDG